MKLKPKQKEFADYYIASGNAEESAVKAGYSKAYARGNAHKLVANSCIKEYIQERNKQLESDRIVSMEEVKRFWSETIRDINADLKHRLKASEYIAKTNAAFIEKQQITGEIDNKLTVVFDAGLDDE